MQALKIKKIIAREILNCLGFPTIESIVVLDDGSVGIFSVPSGTSTGKHEAKELRDNDPSRFRGLGVLKALEKIHSIAPQLIGKDASNQEQIDRILTGIDGTKDKSQLGANSILSLSAATLKAAAASQKIPLYQYIARLHKGNTREFSIPTPMFNLINGGKHASGNLDFQEFLVFPKKSNSYSENLKLGVEIYYQLKDTIQERNGTILTGIEGGYAPSLYSNSDAFKLLRDSVAKTSYEAGLDVFFGLDVAATHLKKGSIYKLKDKPVALTASDLMDFFISLNEQFHLLSIEDPYSEDDWDDWKVITENLGKDLLIVGDDLIATNPERLAKAISQKACNAIVVKPNQIGTISEALNVVKIAQKANFKIVVSHRSGETNDDFIADFAVGIAADYAKLGAPSRGERVAKYNRLLEVEHELS